MKIMCVKCGKQLKCKKNEVIVEESVDSNSSCIWEADLWECRKCGVEIITGFGLKPIAEHWQENYQEILAKVKKRARVYRLEL